MIFSFVPFPCSPYNRFLKVRFNFLIFLKLKDESLNFRLSILV